MNALDTLASLDSLHTAVSHAAHVVPLAAGDDDILGWIRTKANEVRTTFVVIAGAVAAGFVIYNFIRSRAMAALISAGITAAIFTWLVTHNGDVQNRIDNEINSLRAPSVVVDEPASAVAVNGSGALVFAERT